MVDSIKLEKNYNQIGKQVDGRQWSQTLRCWHIPDNEKSLVSLHKCFKEKFMSKSENNRFFKLFYK